MNFYITFIAVLVMLLFAIPGYLLVKLKKIDSQHISSFSKVLMIVCQPCLTIYSFQKVEYNNELTINMLIVFGMGLIVLFSFIAIFYFLFNNKQDNVLFRISNIACVFGNLAFLGVPLMETILPEYTEAPTFCTIFMTAMNIIGWTLASTIITRDKKYISIKKIFLNPATISFVIAIVLYACNINTITINNLDNFYIRHALISLENIIFIFARMATALCMMILGMRLADMKLKQIFGNYFYYIIVGVKQIVMPLIVFGILYFIPLDNNLKITFVILCSCPIAAVVQNFAELLNEGQDDAANLVLLGTLLSIVTMPLITLIIM